MPPKSLNGQSNPHTFVKNAVENLNIFITDFVPVDFFKQRLLEEGSRRQLLVVTGDGDCFSTINGSNCVFRNNLRCFVKENHIKFHQFRGEKLAHRHRTHEQTRFKPQKEMSNSLKKSPNRY